MLLGTFQDERPEHWVAAVRWNSLEAAARVIGLSTPKISWKQLQACFDVSGQGVSAIMLQTSSWWNSWPSAGSTLRLTKDVTQRPTASQVLGKEWPEASAVSVVTFHVGIPPSAKGFVHAISCCSPPLKPLHTWVWINTYFHTIFRGIFTSILTQLWLDVNKKGVLLVLTHCWVHRPWCLNTLGFERLGWPASVASWSNRNFMKFRLLFWHHGSLNVPIFHITQPWMVYGI